MPDSLAQLEKQRAELFRQLADLGDFRRGSITTTSGKCGKPVCHCAQPNDPGHGPNFRLTRKLQGKTVTETFASPVDLRKAQREVDAFHRFQGLCAQIVVVNERICGLRPLEQTLTHQEKNGRSDPAGSRLRSRPTAASGLSGAPQKRGAGSGSLGDGHAIGHASGRGRGLGSVVAVRSPQPGSATPGLPLRSSGTLS